MKRQPGDIELLRRYRREGCEQSLSEVVRRHRAMIYGTCLRVLRDHSQAADAVQDVLMLLLRKADELLERDALAPWLYWAAINTSRGHRRSAARRERAEHEAHLVSRRPAGAQSRAFERLQMELDSALEALPERNRTALLMAYYQGLPQRQIAVKLGVPAATLRSRVSAGLRRLRRRLASPQPVLAAPALKGPIEDTGDAGLDAAG